VWWVAHQDGGASVNDQLAGIARTQSEGFAGRLDIGALDEPVSTARTRVCAYVRMCVCMRAFKYI